MTHRVLLTDQTGWVGGSIVSLYHLVKGLDRSRFEPVIVMAAQNPYVERFRGLGIQVIGIHWAHRPPPGLGLRDTGLRVAALRRVAAFISAVREVRPSLVHFNNVITAHRGEILWCRAAGVRTVCHMRGFPRLTRLDRFLSGGVSRYIFVSRAVEEAFLASGAKVRGGHVVYNGVDVAQFRPMPEMRAEVRDELGLPQDAQVAAIVGRLVPWKGLELFLDALERLACEIPSLWGLVLGGGEGPFAAFEGQLRSKVEGGTMKGRVVFAGYRPDVSRLLSTVDVLVNASVKPEAFGRTVIEGMACGVPVVASAIGGVPEMVEEGKTGLLFPPGEEEALAEAVAKVVSMPDLAAKLSREGRREAETRFRSEFYVAGVEAVYESLLGVAG